MNSRGIALRLMMNRGCRLRAAIFISPYVPYRALSRNVCHTSEQDDEHHEHGEQAARKDEKVLAFQPLELHRLADTPVYRIFCHTPVY